MNVWSTAEVVNTDSLKILLYVHGTASIQVYCSTSFSPSVISPEYTKPSHSSIHVCQLIRHVVQQPWLYKAWIGLAWASFFYFLNKLNKFHLSNIAVTVSWDQLKQLKSSTVTIMTKSSEILLKFCPPKIQEMSFLQYMSKWQRQLWVM